MRNRNWEDRRRFESGPDRGEESSRWAHEGNQGDWGRESRAWHESDRGEWSGGAGDSQRSPGDWGGGGGYGSQYSRQSAFGNHGSGNAGAGYRGRQNEYESGREYGSGRASYNDGESGGSWTSGGNGGTYDASRRNNAGAAGYGMSRGQSNGYSPEDLRGPSGMYQGSGTFGSQEGSGQSQYSNRGSMGRGRESGRHAGKGPKGYTRSDDRIREDISDRLMADGDVDATDIEIEVRGGEVVLRGLVDSRDTKRCAEDLAESVQGVQNVQNQLRVRGANGTNTDAGSTATGSTVSGSTNRTTEASSKHR